MDLRLLKKKDDFENFATLSISDCFTSDEGSKQNIPPFINNIENHTLA